MTTRRPTRKPVQIADDLPKHYRRHLLRGIDYFNDAYGKNVDIDPEAMDRMRADWEVYGDDLVAEWAVAHPGTRPYGYWLFSSPERRRTLNGARHPFDNPRRRTLCDEWHAQYPAVRHDVLMWQLVYGIPRISIGDRVQYETEADYLARLNLLLPGEAEAMKDHVPEECVGDDE